MQWEQRTVIQSILIGKTSKQSPNLDNLYDPYFHMKSISFILTARHFFFFSRCSIQTHNNKNAIHHIYKSSQQLNLSHCPTKYFYMYSEFHQLYVWLLVPSTSCGFPETRYIFITKAKTKVSGSHCIFSLFQETNICALLMLRKLNLPSQYDVLFQSV